TLPRPRSGRAHVNRLAIAWARVVPDARPCDTGCSKDVESAFDVVIARPQLGTRPGPRRSNVAPRSPSPRSGGYRHRSRFEARSVSRRNLASATEWPGPRRHDVIALRAVVIPEMRT